MNRADQYAVEMMCLNCFQRVRMWFPKGTKVADSLKCPTCECLALSSRGAILQESKAGNWFAQVVDTFFNGRKAS